ncbi:trypsin-like serine peptidase [Spirosoma spitsbergense]|uniref:trypsin-like serine peptidase n=1 Tax=Spirosoma spitsbergense TaxID=431554 RepID=UPI000363C571|nr:trypsin-like peptidase domain-containing protein [Spirosoma spitsbergense]
MSPLAPNINDDTDPATGPGDDRLLHYRQLLLARENQTRSTESAGGGDPEPDLTDPAIRDRLDQTTADWNQIIKQHLGDKPKLHRIVKQIVTNADEALRVVRDNDVERIRKKPQILEHLESIVRTDGSRPSFMIRQGRVDKSTSPLGDWEASLDASVDLLTNAIACVGRINLPSLAGGFAGTGFLIHPNLILTNRHVLQLIARQQTPASWVFDPKAGIDFGQEFRGLTSVNPRKFKGVVFTGRDPIAGLIDHTHLDLALIELEPVPVEQTPRQVLAVDMAPDWPDSFPTVYTIGYPANDPSVPPTLLEKLFLSTFGCKRLAPGLVMNPPSAPVPEPFRTGHDATTLGGNSGSVVLVAGREHLAAGLHYAGKSREPRVNSAHVLGRVLDQTDGQTAKTLREHLTGFGVKLVDRFANLA